MTLSVVSPCYNEEGNVLAFYEAVLAEFSKIEQIEKNAQIEFVLVDDGSRDATAQVLEGLSTKDSRVKPLYFSRNFGKEAAVFAGLSHASGDLVLLLDADLQHPVELILPMFNAVCQGADVAFARRKRRKGEGFFRTIFSNLFYKFNQFLSGVEVAQGTMDFRLMRREVVDAFLQVGEYHRFCKNIFEWLGFKKVAIEFEVAPQRHSGRSSWSFKKLFAYALNGIFSFSATPLRICFAFGLFFSFLGGSYGFYLVVKWLIMGNPIGGWTTLASLICFFSGLVLIGQGIKGEYIARIYEQSKFRPHYILRKSAPKLGKTPENKRLDLSGEKED